MEVLSPQDAFAQLLPQPGTTLTEQQQKLVAFDQKFTDINPLIEGSALKDHLLFLKAVDRLVTSIEDNFVVKNAATGEKAPAPGTRVLLSKAVYRYHVWITKYLPIHSISGSVEDIDTPPLDVLIILHSHMLAPWRFYEDSRLRFPQLGCIGQFPFNRIVDSFLFFKCVKLISGLLTDASYQC